MTRTFLWALALFGLMFSLSAGMSIASANNTPTTITRDGVTLTMSQEHRAEVIGNQLRCLVCQNETVENSQAGLARQFRGIIRRRVVEGWSNRQVIRYMVHRYGIFILLKPPLIPMTALLWFSPIIALAVGTTVILAGRRRRMKPVPELEPDEQKRLKELLN